MRNLVRQYLCLAKKQEQTQHLINKVTTLAKQLRAEQIRSESLEKHISSQNTKESLEENNPYSRVYTIHKEALQRQVNELTERLTSNDRETE